MWVFLWTKMVILFVQSHFRISNKHSLGHTTSFFQYMFAQNIDIIICIYLGVILAVPFRGPQRALMAKIV